MSHGSQGSAPRTLPREVLKQGVQPQVGAHPDGTGAGCLSDLTQAPLAPQCARYVRERKVKALHEDEIVDVATGREKRVKGIDAAAEQEPGARRTRTGQLADRGRVARGQQGEAPLLMRPLHNLPRAGDELGAGVPRDEQGAPEFERRQQERRDEAVDRRSQRYIGRFKPDVSSSDPRGNARAGGRRLSAGALQLQWVVQSQPLDRVSAWTKQEARRGSSYSRGSTGSLSSP